MPWPGRSRIVGGDIAGLDGGSPLLYASSMNIPLDRRKPVDALRSRLHEIIFEADSRAGRLFDLALI
jgi:hypothetical protein